MNDQQENRFSMFIKVQEFLGDHAAALAAVPAVAVKKTELDALLAQIVAAEAIATTDTTGYTEAKEDARQALGEISLKVARAASALFLNTGDKGKLREADLLKSELARSRDTALYVKSLKLFDLADPVKASLTNYNSGPADVTDLQAKATAYYNIIQTPESKRGEKAASGKDVDVLITDTDELLEELDIYLDTFEFTDLNLYNQYLAARAIDDMTGGGGGETILGTVQNTVGVNTISNAGALPVGTQKIRMTGILNGPLEFGLSSDGLTAIGNTTTLGAPASTTYNIADFASAGTMMVVRNQNLTLTGEYKIEFLG